MAASGSPIGAMRVKLERRLRWFTLYHVIGVVIAVAAIGSIALSSGSNRLLWAFVFIAIVMPVGVPLVWVLNRRGLNRTLHAFEALEPRVRDARPSVSTGCILVLDNGLVLATDSRTNVIRFVAYLSAGDALLHPEMTQAERWGMRVRGMQTDAAITMKKGPPQAQAELERFRIALAAKWYLFFLREVKRDRLAPGDPMWHAALTFFIPRWPDHAKQIAQELDNVAAFLVEVRAKYFQGTGS